MVALPSHIPVIIDVKEINDFREALISEGFDWTFFQIVKPKQELGLVKNIQYNEIVVEHHVRCYRDGKITTELELRRLEDMWLHLTSHSISAHEYVIEILEKYEISYEIDQDLRQQFLEFGPTKFKRDYLELFRWLIYGVLFWTPLGYMWKFFEKLTGVTK